MKNSFREHWNQDVINRILILCFVPALATLGVMFAVYGLIGGLLLFRQSLVEITWIGIFALLMVFIVPQFTIGLLMGYWQGFEVQSPAAIGIAPVILLVFTIGLYDGPILAVMETPWLTGGAVLGWITIAAIGMLIGSKASDRNIREKL